MGFLSGKKILFGITGGIAAYKAADWVSALRKEGAEITVVMTESATRFVAPLTFAALSGNTVHTGMFDADGAETIPHISLAKEADLILIAPATANTVAKLAHGLADDLLSTVVLASRAPVLVFPAMNSNMYLHPATQANLQQLAQYGYRLIAPESGSMACGDIGPGRLPAYGTALTAVESALRTQDLAGRTFLITAGPTEEPLDPVRFLSNRSTGKMGFALARAAMLRGAAVTLISGPTHLAPPPDVSLIGVRTAAEMHKAVLQHSGKAEVIIKAAAVSDYRPCTRKKHKIKKGEKSMPLTLTANTDILKELGTGSKKRSDCFLVGFAAESRNHLAEGKRKLREKHLDLMVVNDILGTETGFGADTNQVTLLDAKGTSTKLPLSSKEETAHAILDRIVSVIAS